MTRQFPDCGCVRDTPCERCPGHVPGSEGRRADRNTAIADDAARYRWLRAEKFARRDLDPSGYACPDDYDAAIDEAIRIARGGATE